jgi:hypothetical protein
MDWGYEIRYLEKNVARNLVIKNAADPCSGSATLDYCEEKFDNNFTHFLAGEMMMSLLWFYRPEHTDIGRQVEDLPEEVFASRHRDHTSVACIEDKCYVMTINEYCR